MNPSQLSPDIENRVETWHHLEFTANTNTSQSEEAQFSQIKKPENQMASKLMDQDVDFMAISTLCLSELPNCRYQTFRRIVNDGCFNMDEPILVTSLDEMRLIEDYLKSNGLKSNDLMFRRLIKDLPLTLNTVNHDKTLHEMVVYESVDFLHQLDRYFQGLDNNEIAAKLQITNLYISPNDIELLQYISAKQSKLTYQDNTYEVGKITFGLPPLDPVLMQSGWEWPSCLQVRFIQNRRMATDTSVGKEIYKNVSNFIKTNRQWLVFNGNKGIGKDELTKLLLKEYVSTSRNIKFYHYSASRDQSLLDLVMDLFNKNPIYQHIILVSELNLLSTEALRQIQHYIQDKPIKIVGTQNPCNTYKGRFKSYELDWVESVNLEGYCLKDLLIIIEKY